MGVRKSRLKVLGMILLNKNDKLLHDLEKRLVSLEGKIREKRKRLSKLNGRLRTNKVFDELQAKNQELELKIMEMKSNLGNGSTVKPNTEDTPNVQSITTSNFDGMENIKKKYPNLPENQIERIEVERTIARHLMARNSGCFYVSQVLKALEEIYSIKSNDRITLLTEIKSWIERDPLCRVAKTIDKVHHHTLI